MSDEWVSVHLLDIAIKDARAFAMGPFGSNIRAENYREAGVPVIRGTNLGQEGESPFKPYDYAFLTEEKADGLASSNAYPNDVVFVAQGTVGKVGIIPANTNYRRFVLSQNLMKVTIDSKRADPRFVFYFFRSALGQHEIAAHVNPTGVPCISKPLTSLRQFRLRMPVDAGTQRAIADVLGSLDDKIELNRRMNETLEAAARAIFKSWFVDFDPVRAKAEGRRPAGMDAATAALFPDWLVESDLDKIPRGWEICSLPEAIEVNPVRVLRKGETAPYLDMASMPIHSHSPDVVTSRPFGSGMRFTNGDTLVARITPCLENGKTAFVDFLEDGQVGWGSTEYIVLRSKPPLPNEFAYCLARSEGFREFAIQSMTGSSGRQRVPAESLAHFPIVRPPKAIAEQFGRLMRPLFARARAATAESRVLAAIRDALLPKLLTGEIRINRDLSARSPGGSKEPIPC